MLGLVIATTPAVAQTEWDDLIKAQIDAQAMEAARKIGWLQAVCSLYKLGSLNPVVSEMTINSVMNDLDKDSRRLASHVKKSVLTTYPDCRKVWPRKYVGY